MEINHLPLYIQIRNDIKEKIEKGIFNVEQQIPTENELRKLYKVSRATIRQAISYLEQEGYIFKRKGIGTFVCNRSKSSSFEPLISFTYSLDAKGYKLTNVIKEKQILITDKLLNEKLKWKENGKCLYLKRLRFVDNYKVALEYSYFSTNIDTVNENIDFTSSIAKIILNNWKVNINKVEQVSILRSASKEECLELDLKNDSNVLELKRWIYIEDEEAPFYYLKFIVPSAILENREVNNMIY